MPEENKSPLISFGTVLKQFREERKLTQTAFGIFINRSASYISLLESDARRPPQELLAPIRDALRLNDEEYHRLTLAAGFDIESVEHIMRNVAEATAQQYSAEDADSKLFFADFQASRQGWVQFFALQQMYRQGKFQDTYKGLLVLDKKHMLSPTLKCYIHLLLSEVLLNMGDFLRGHEHARLANKAIEDLTNDQLWAPTLRAEIWANMGAIQLRLGSYEPAKTYFDHSLATYRHREDDEYEHMISSFGLAKSHKRLAQVALFRGDPSKAIRHIITAEHHLSQIADSPTKRQWSRKIQELRAWAYSEQNDVKRAIDLRLQTRNEYEKDHDTFGLIKNSLFLADDYRRHLDFKVEASGANLEADPDNRKKKIRRELSHETRFMDSATTEYENAIKGFRHHHEGLLVGRALRGLAIVLRYRAACESGDKGKNPYVQAQKLLSEAESHETHIGQLSRLSSIYESRASLEWDWGSYEESLSFYREIFQIHQRPTLRKSDATSDVFFQRAEKAIQALNQILQKTGYTPTGKWHAHPGSLHMISNEGSEVSEQDQRLYEWDAYCQELIELSSQQILVARRARLVAESDRNIDWLKLIIDVESSKGPRYVAQNHLSYALTQHIPGGYLPEAVHLLVTRYLMLRQQLADIEHAQNHEPYVDLCHINSITKGKKTHDVVLLNRDQLKEAKALSQQFPHAYRLIEGQFRLPFGFLIKENVVLLEVPIERELAGIMYPTDAQLTDDQVLCYEIRDKEYAVKVKDIFLKHLVRLALPPQMEDEPTYSVKDMTGTYNDEGSF